MVLRRINNAEGVHQVTLCKQVLIIIFLRKNCHLSSSSSSSSNNNMLVYPGLQTLNNRLLQRILSLSSRVMPTDEAMSGLGHPSIQLLAQTLDHLVTVCQ